MVKIKHNKKLLVAIIIVAVLLVFVLIIIQKKEKQGKSGECSKDEDCIFQQTTCCSCNMGGNEVCMPKENSTYWKSKLEKCEKNIICIALYNCKEISCVCKENKCIEK